VPKRSVPKWAMPKRATTKRAMIKWSCQNDMLPRITDCKYEQNTYNRLQIINFDTMNLLEIDGSSPEHFNKKGTYMLCAIALKIYWFNCHSSSIHFCTHKILFLMPHLMTHKHKIIYNYYNVRNLKLAFTKKRFSCL